MRKLVLPVIVATGGLVSASCRSAGNASNQALTPQADSLLACAERELFAHGYRVTRMTGNRPRLRAEPQLTANTARPQTVMVEYDPDTHGLDVWLAESRATPGAVEVTPEVTQLAWALADACTPKEGKREP